MIFTIALYVIAAIFLVISSQKDKKKTSNALKKAWKRFENLLPQFISILIVSGFFLSLLTPEQISRIIGEESGWLGVLISGLFGSITLIPGMISFPLAATLLENGAGIAQISMFISTLMMVGIITLPLEISVFSVKTAVKRNVFAVTMAAIIAIIMGAVL